MTNIGSIAKQRRLALHMSQRSLAAKAMVDQSTICALENGQRGVGINLVADILDALGLKIRVVEK